MQRNCFQNQRLCLKKTPSPQFKVAFYKRLEIKLFLEETTTLFPEVRGKGRIACATMFREMLSKYAILSRVLSKIVALVYFFITPTGIQVAFFAAAEFRW